MALNDIINCTVLISATLINAVLAVIAIYRSREPINVSFFFLSILLSGWGASVALWKYFGMPVFESVNFVFVSLTPLASGLVIASMYKLKKGAMYAALRVFAVLGTLSSSMSFWSIFDSKWSAIFFSQPGKAAIVAFMFSSILFIISYLFFTYPKLKYKTEKNKVKYVLAAFSVLFIGGTFDLIGWFGYTIIWNMGNICNCIYSMIIFTAVFRLRLLDPGIIFRKFIVYLGMAACVTLFLALPGFLQGMPYPMVMAIDFTAIIALIYFGKDIFISLDEFAQKVGGKTASEFLNKEYEFIRSLQASEGSKVMSLLLALKNNMEMEVAVYIKEGDYMIKKMSTGGDFPASVDSSAVPLQPIIRYEESGAKQGFSYSGNIDGFVKEVMKSGSDFVPQNVEYLNSFGADLILPLKYSSDPIGIIAAKKSTTDISFTADEVRVINLIVETCATYMKTHLLSGALAENENMKRIGMMARQMAHEIKNPLASLWGAVQLLSARSPEEEENVRIVREEIRRLSGILDSWTNFARELKLIKEEFDVLKLLYEVIEMTNKKDSGLNVKVKPAGGELVSVIADREKIKQVLLNVFANSMDAVSGRQSALISAEVIKKDTAVDIRIRDNGCGISREDLYRIKEPLFSTKIKGTGLGLSISDRIIKEHGGTLIVESNGKDYTEVTVSVPKLA